MNQSYGYPNNTNNPYNFSGGRNVGAPPLYIGDIDTSIREEQLYDFFSKYGHIQYVRIMKDRNSGKSRGFGFVNFQYLKDAENAKSQAQYSKLGRKNIRIMFKRDVRELPPDANIFVKNLDPNVNVKELHNHFAQVKPVLCAKVATNSEGKSLGYGYVQFEKKEDADAGFKALNGSKLKENEIQLSFFSEKDERPEDFSRRNIYVRELPAGKTDAELETIVSDIFSQYGELESISVKQNPTENKITAFVYFKDEDAADAAYNDLTSNPKTLEGCSKPLYVNWYQDRAELRKQQQQQQGQSDSNLYIKNLRQDVEEEEIRKAFQQFGNITSVSCKEWTNSAGQKNKFAFVCFDNPQDASQAQAQALSVPEVKALYAPGVEPYVNFHQSREKRNQFLDSKGRGKAQMGMGAPNFNPYMQQQQGGYPYPPRIYQQYMMPQMMMMPQMNPQYQQGMGGNFKTQRGGHRGSNQRGQGQGRGYNQGHHGNRQNYQNPNRQQFNQQNNYQNNNYQQNYQNKRNDNRSPSAQGNQQSQSQPHTQQQIGSTSSGMTVHTLKNKVGEFLALDQNKQRQILGELLFPQIQPLAGEHAPRITGMLIDLSVLEITEILDFLENPDLLKERVEEAKELILESENA